MSFEGCAWCDDCQCWGHDTEECRQMKAQEEAVAELHRGISDNELYRTQYQLEVTKRKTNCHGCQEPILKNSVRVLHQQADLTEKFGNVFRPKFYFHLPCWIKSEMRPSSGPIIASPSSGHMISSSGTYKCHSFKYYKGFFMFPHDVQEKILGANEDADKFLRAVPETPKKNSSKKTAKTAPMKRYRAGAKKSLTASPKTTKKKRVFVTPWPPYKESEVVLDDVRDWATDHTTSRRRNELDWSPRKQWSLRWVVFLSTEEPNCCDDIRCPLNHFRLDGECFIPKSKELMCEHAGSLAVCYRATWRMKQMNQASHSCHGLVPL